MGAALVLAGLALVLALLASPARAARPLLILNATSSFDELISDPSRSERRWMRRRLHEIRGYPPFFERYAMPWRPPPSAFYQDLYAIYNPSERGLIERHPDWVFRDLYTRPLFIPYDCAGGSCPQWAADFGTRGWREHWISVAQRTFSQGARADPRGRGWSGIFIDDVNLEMRVSDGDGNHVEPFDMRRLGPMSEQSWQLDMVAMLERIRAAFPEAEITHNSLWWLPRDDPEVVRQVLAADRIELERGFNDAGIVAGGGTFGYETFLGHVDWLHSLGREIVLEPYLENATEARYELANYFLVREGDDAIASHFRPGPRVRGGPRPWRGWRVNPGPALGFRVLGSDGLWRRQFARWTAIVNPPGGAPATVQFAEPHRSLSGAEATSFALGPREGDVYVPAAG